MSDICVVSEGVAEREKSTEWLEIDDCDFMRLLLNSTDGDLSRVSRLLEKFVAAQSCLLLPRSCLESPT
jgi:hypothetical protein